VSRTGNHERFMVCVLLKTHLGVSKEVQADGRANWTKHQASDRAYRHLFDPGTIHRYESIPYANLIFEFWGVRYEEH
jgi:hypothetical protein